MGITATILSGRFFWSLPFVAHSDFLVQLSQIAKHNRHRFLVELVGEESWCQALARELIDVESPNRSLKLGGEEWQNIPTKNHQFGTKVLGTELTLLIYDCASGFDANSFAAACGTVVGGGIVILLNRKHLNKGGGSEWLASHLDGDICIEQDKALPALPIRTSEKIDALFTDQLAAIKAITKVVSGRRKRPLVMTADRGRGKSSSLGMASAELMRSRKMKIVVTAPATKAVVPVFEHANQMLGHGPGTSGFLIESEGSTLRYIAPDELLLTKPECDILIVDEASAIPVPMLIAMTEHYHRMVFSTTVHGYEGCGRGFTLKFTKWLQENRSGWQSLHLNQPIRWAEDDPLERWLFDAFLLDAEIEEVDSTLQEVVLKHIDKKALTRDKSLLKRCFGLLVNAHYQTSPNDLFQLLSDSSTDLWMAWQGKQLVGCLSTVREGDLSSDVIDGIVTGKRRPKGHLVPSSLANHLGVDDAAKESSARVMRIAVHPTLQRKGVGKVLLDKLEEALESEVTYLSTSFGATKELLQFWLACGYLPLRVGSSRDQASGAHSVIMVRTLKTSDWYCVAKQYWETNFFSQLSGELKTIEPWIVEPLVQTFSLPSNSLNAHELQMLQRYAQGGNGAESSAVLLAKLTMMALKSGFGEAAYPLVAKFLQQQSWSEVVAVFGFSGRKSLEKYIREQVAEILVNLHCKFD
ncbi:putative P-loop ATPase fused to an acetyltransferase [Vibrio nigripulchritudo MADA3029]|uniref:tRNA(Met) cytidine acetyltransferase TmcA n=1 Tax=Vibrio nigripulchritudo TaxID=28173 RepID=UPI0003B2390D|nr:GNAT family N-acetyltransferase [Vibrio nigripulchritudo]CCN47297.1 putative P-loop ATPase fused to an acetyltransferase [Vibrio nigripulchritudo MADA3020]CCN55162.1 putative P-loop ATPase fused to an acetyltransferase [Vibrio nigripulchritudo MADA3021]CCN60941.1 putative P-loop ATPase fused to an acetyltransferase [Vibrio nigripulchritudo MADA3029]